MNDLQLQTPAWHYWRVGIEKDEISQMVDENLAKLIVEG